jgi:hypothetical protein
MLDFLCIGPVMEFCVVLIFLPVNSGAVFVGRSLDEPNTSISFLSSSFDMLAAGAAVAAAIREPLCRGGPLARDPPARTGPGGLPRLSGILLTLAYPSNAD